MQWNANLKVYEKGNMVALWHDGELEKIPKENYIIISKLIEEDVNIRDIPTLFERKSDGEYIVSVIEMLLKKRAVVGGDLEKGKKREYDVTLMLTNGCNLSCNHCCQDAEKDLCNELSTVKILEIIDELSSKSQITSLTITGGEPLIRKDFIQIVKYIKKKMNCKMHLLSNGLLINQSNVRFLTENFDAISLSLDGSTAELTEIIRGVDVFDIVVEKVRMLKEYSVGNISVSAVLPKICEVEEEFLNLCKDLNVEPMIRSFSYAGRGRTGEDKIMKGYNEYAKKRGLKFYDQYLQEDLQNIENCAACENCFTIDPKGKIKPCNILLDPEFEIGDIFELKDEDWLDKIYKFNKVIDYKEFRNTPCENCNYNVMCWHCVSELHYALQDIEAFEKRCKTKKELMEKLIWGERE